MFHRNKVVLLYHEFNPAIAGQRIWTLDDGIKSVATVKRYEKLTKYFHVNDPAQGTRNFHKLYKEREFWPKKTKKCFHPSRNVLQLMRQ